MKPKRLLFIATGISCSLFLLALSFFLFPRFLWRTDTELGQIESAIKKGESLGQYNDKGATPLIGAAAQNMFEGVRDLLNGGANIEAHANNPTDLKIEMGNTALHYACLNGNADIVKLLISRGALSYSLNDNKNTPLYTLINSVDTPLEQKELIMDTLFGNNAQLMRIQWNLQNKQGWTPLMRAGKLRNYGLVKLILNKWGQYIDYMLKNEDEDTTLGVVVKDAADDSIIRMIRNAQEKWGKGVGSIPIAQKRTKKPSATPSAAAK